MTGNCHVRCGVGENFEITSKNYLSLSAQNPSLRCDPELTKSAVSMLEHLPFTAFRAGIRSSGSDDFAEITSRIPSVYLFLSAGIPEGEQYPSHHPKVQFDEAVLPLGAAALAYLAESYLKSQFNSSIDI